MSDSNHAVFLSYASQDSEAAKRIAEALRAAGVEVWFDQSELRGGDSWDQKIRKQIKECALFVPVISVNTQSRLEGYFRREWRMAIDRSHDMDDDMPFLLPVVVDDTPDAGARVPERFRERQWTRLPAGETPPGFAERVKRLLDGDVVAGGADPGLPTETSAKAGPASARPATIKPGPSRPWLLPTIIGGALIAGLVIWQSWWKPAATAPVAASTSEARQLVAQARAAFEKPDPLRSDLDTAGQLLGRAQHLDDVDSEVWAAEAQLASVYVWQEYDTSDERNEALRTAADRALKLAPKSFEARLAAADSLSWVSGNVTEAKAILLDLLRQHPDDHRILIALGLVTRNTDRLGESLAYFTRATELPGSDAIALCEGGFNLWGARHLDEAGAWADRSLAVQPTSFAYALKFWVAFVRGDLDEALVWIKKLPQPFLMEDYGAAISARLRLERREPGECLAVLRAVPRDYLNHVSFTGPKGYLTGLAQEMAGRPAAARADWSAASQVIDQRLAGRSNDPVLIRWKATLQACLGEREAADRNLRLSQQLAGRPEDLVSEDIFPVLARLGRNDALIGYARDQLRHWTDPKTPVDPAERRGLLTDLWTTLRYNYELDPLRADPRFAPLLPQTEAELQRLPVAKAAQK
jgi:hypothetical protein